MISFIVLHYKNISETLTCLKHLKKLNGDKSIIVVDNNTLSAEDEIRITEYTMDILKLDKNYGYAKANNFGIEYAKKKYNSDFYFIINNDVYISDVNINDKIIQTYNEYKFDMLGPYIDSPTGESINPFPIIYGKEKIEAEINKCKKLIRIYNNSIFYLILKIYLKLKYLIKKPKTPTNGECIKTGVALHGCALVFSKKYITKYKFPFYNETFLFHEEEFLYNRVIKDGLISVYNPEIKVYHEEGLSIKNSNKNIRLSKLFRENERLKSLKLLLKQI